MCLFLEGSKVCFDAVQEAYAAHEIFQCVKMPGISEQPN